MILSYGFIRCECRSVFLLSARSGSKLSLFQNVSIWVWLIVQFFFVQLLLSYLHIPFDGAIEFDIAVGNMLPLGSLWGILLEGGNCNEGTPTGIGCHRCWNTLKISLSPSLMLRELVLVSFAPH